MCCLRVVPTKTVAAVLFAFSTLNTLAQTDAVWLALRSDDRAGTGTRGDPFNGNTAERLDVLLRAILPRTRIHFGAGTFITRGIQAKDGWRISGLGKDRTIIKLADGTAVGGEGTNYAIISKYFDGVWLKYFELRNLTLDCNREKQPVFFNHKKGCALSAYLVSAKNAKVADVRVRGTWADPGEGFPCMIAHDGSSGNEDRIEISDVENLNPLGYLTAISVLDQHGGSVSGFIRNCLVTDHKDGSAFGSGGWRNFEVSHNRTRNVAIPIVIDTHDYRDVRIHHNRFRNCLGWAILCNGGGVYEGIKIFDNLFEMGPKAGPCVNSGNGRVELDVRRNRIVQTGSAEPIVSKGPNTNATLRGNLVQRSRSDAAAQPK